MKKVVIIGAILVLAAMANAVTVNHADTGQTIVDGTGVTIIPVNEVVASHMTGNVKISDSPDNDMQPTISRDPNGRIIVAYATQHSIIDQDLSIMYSSDGSTWTRAAQMISTEGGILQYPAIVGIPDAGDVGLGFMDPLTEYPLVLYRMTDITDTETYTGVAYSWGETEDYEEVAVTSISYLFVTLFTNHNLYMYDLEGCPYLAYWTQELDGPPEIGGNYFDGQSILKTAPASNIDMATGQDYFYLLMEHYNETTGHSEIAFKKSVTDLDLLFTSGGGPGGMDKYADIEAMPWQRYLAKGDFDAQDPNVAASGSNVAVVYMTNDNIYGDWNVECWYSSDNGETWSVSTPGGTPQVDETSPAVFMSGNDVYCVYEKAGNLYLTKSEDGGATWNEPEQINEVDGTVVSAPRAIAISDGGIVWTDTRDGNMDIYYSPLPMAILSIDITGGFGVKATVTNTGTAAGENIAWSVDLSGLVFLGGHSEGTIASLPPGASETVGPGLVLGIGPTTITATAGGVTKTANGFVLGPMVLGL